MVKAVYDDEIPDDKYYPFCFNVLPASYVKKRLGGKKNSAIACASYLAGTSDFDAFFYANFRRIETGDVSLIGVLKEAPKAP